MNDNSLNKNMIKRVMIIGAGWTGNMLIEKIRMDKGPVYDIRCIIDDDPKKLGQHLQGIEIVGNRDTIVENAKKYNINQIIIALPSANKKEVRKILEICKLTGCNLKVVPSLYEIDEQEIEVTRLRNVNIEDLLGRDPVVINNSTIKSYIKGAVVAITGAGGSIGSELARQVALNKPQKLILLDIYENTIYEIQQELLNNFPELNLEVLIASVRNKERICSIFQTYHPDVVFHAAAHKHVPLMEYSPNEAIKNNVFGTCNVAEASGESGVKKFVLISTDKAVNPTNIMGASKRICEMIIQMMNHYFDKTDFVAVRFGNVLGSNGSVVPLFKKQILKGGPVTVTDPEIIRYFMTIPEAVSLVLQAGAYANGGEIFVLDMGQPVKILDLAKNLIRLSGFTEEEIGIEFIGLRPGEKLYEELLMDEEGMKSTENKLIYIGNPIEFDEEDLIVKLKELKGLVDSDETEVRKKVKEIVPTYYIEN